MVVVRAKVKTSPGSKKRPHVSSNEIIPEEKEVKEKKPKSKKIALGPSNSNVNPLQTPKIPLPDVAMQVSHLKKGAGAAGVDVHEDPPSSHKAKLYLPCPKVQADRRADPLFLALEDKCSRMRENQAFFRTLEDWEFRKYTNARHTVQTECASILELREEAIGIVEEMMTIYEDQEREWKNELPPLNERTLWEQVQFPLTLNLTHQDVLSYVAGFPDPTEAENRLNSARPSEKIEEAKSDLKDFFEAVVQIVDKRTERIHSLYRAFPLKFLNDPELIEWTVQAIPLHWTAQLLSLVRDKKTRECQILAFLVLLQEMSLQGSNLRAKQIKIRDELKT